MKRNRSLKLACIAITISFAFAVTPIWSQENMGPPPGGMGPGGNMGHGHGMPSAQERTDHLAKELNLSEDQKAKVLSIYQDEDKQMSALHSNSGASREDRWSKMKQIHESTASQIKGVLNAQQAKQFEAMEKRMEEGHHRGGGMAPQQ